ncbi:MAG TPA: hypothetical protein VE967_12830 [Gemmatimonadaceae bacterium]|nr:hypothetical protein [Gemmatimonadaceae bacterium]
MNRRILVLGGFAILTAAACNEKRALLSDPIGASAYGYQMQQQATNIPRGSVRFKFHATPAAVTPDSFVVTLQGIDSLGPNGFYTAWAGDSLGTTFKRITGVLEAQRTDTALDALGNVLSQPQPKVTVGTFSAIQNGSARTTYTWRFERTNAGLAATDSMVVFLITVEDNNAATTPNATRRPLWARRSEGGPAGGLATSTLRFGNYAGNPLSQYLFVPTPARGRGVIWGSILEVTDSTLSRPPLGYYYAVYAVKEVPPGQTNGDTLFVGDLTSPYPRRNLSLYNADSIRTDPLVVLDIPPSISVGAARISADTVSKLPKDVVCTDYGDKVVSCPYKGYSNVRLTLESKNAIRGRMGPARILGAAIPFVVTAGQR